MHTVLITGGAGFIGVHAVRRFLAAGYRVVVLDNMSRKGTTQNADYLRGAGGALAVEEADVRDWAAVQAVFRRHAPFHAVVHLAGQVAVTTSVQDPRHDFECNALGTFNTLEAVRTMSPLATVVFASTNKVYGSLPGVAVAQRESRYVLENLPQGVAEDAPLDFHSPYGCSKGAADQYVHDYARIYGLKTVVCRQSCIYGTRQFGIEDQGWVAWFSIAAQLGLPISIYGDGMQVRDVLFVEDLVELYVRLVTNADRVAGAVFNVGGGPASAISLLDLLAVLQAALGRPVPHTFAPWRPGDQRVYVSNIDRVCQATGWSPRTPVQEGVSRLLAWTREHETLVRQVLGYPAAGVSSR